MKVTVSEGVRRRFFIGVAGILTLIAVPASFAAEESSPIPPGTQITIRTVDRIESRKAEAGQSYRCTLNAPIVVAGKEVSGRGADCVLRVVEITQSGKLTGSSELKLEVSQIRVGSDLMDVNSDPSRMESKGKGKSTGIKTGIGALAGAAAGVATAALTQGPEIKVAPETVLNFVIH